MEIQKIGTSEKFITVSNDPYSVTIFDRRKKFGFCVVFDGQREILEFIKGIDELKIMLGIKPKWTDRIRKLLFGGF